MFDEDGNTVIGVIGTSRDENHAFIYLAKHFEKRRLPVPHLLAVSADELCYLQTDLGNTSLSMRYGVGERLEDAINLAEQKLLRNAIRELPNIQLRGARGLGFL